MGECGITEAWTDDSRSPTSSARVTEWWERLVRSLVGYSWDMFDGLAEGQSSPSGGTGKGL